MSVASFAAGALGGVRAGGGWLIGSTDAAHATRASASCFSSMF